ncbi:MAG: TIM barrel protein, partial [Nitrospinota bacterium]|nr:TIM barrel protein [Nitrospinota bacterium]
VTRDACLKTYVENLRWATGALAEFGLRLLIEPINQHGVPGYFLSRTEEALEVIDRVGADNLLLLYDIYHAQIAEGNLAQTLREHIDRIGHIHIAGVPGRHEPDFGEIKYPYLFELLDELGYDGWVGAEYRPRAGTVQGLGWARGYGIG